ncbi:hypothetical protein KCU67_g2, partial [Aureobasidium melanogenum]
MLSFPETNVAKFLYRFRRRTGRGLGKPLNVLHVFAIHHPSSHLYNRMTLTTQRARPHGRGSRGPNLSASERGWIVQGSEEPSFLFSRVMYRAL